MPRLQEHHGVTLAFDAAGSGDPPMVFVHGWLCDRSHYAPHLEHFAARHAVVGLDLPGHGGSGRPSPHSDRYGIVRWPRTSLQWRRLLDASTRSLSVTASAQPIRSGLPGDAPSDLQAACPTITIGQTVGAGHFIQLEVPEQVIHMIERFLAVNDI